MFLIRSSLRYIIYVSVTISWALTYFPSVGEEFHWYKFLPYPLSQ